ncbi:MAG TPA: PIG-L family deacetylase [Bryobacteraceae bacterium]|nr:PIG-L family deacetylase [Bryobacteraceae bacterium]
MPTNILAVAAHPGDAFFTMGAAVAQHIQAGGRGAFLSLSLGERGHPSIAPGEYGEMQRQAAEKAAKHLGATNIFLTYPDGEVPANEESSLAVCDIIREQKPGVILTHWSGSWHKDHQNTFLVVRDAIFYAGLAAMRRKLPAHDVGKLFFADNWEDATNYQADTFLDTTPVNDKWIEACAMFPMWRGETGLIRYNDYYQSLAVMRGALAGFRYAIALMSDPNQRVSRVKSLA